VSAGWKPALAACDRHRRAADLYALDAIRRAVDACKERRRPTDLRALGDLDLVAEGDPAVTREMQGQRAGGRARGRILRDSTARREHPRLPPRTGTREAVDPEIRRKLVPRHVVTNLLNLLLRPNRLEIVRRVVVLESDRL